MHHGSGMPKKKARVDTWKRTGVETTLSENPKNLDGLSKRKFWFENHLQRNGPELPALLVSSKEQNYERRSHCWLHGGLGCRHEQSQKETLTTQGEESETVGVTPS